MKKTAALATAAAAIAGGLVASAAMQSTQATTLPTVNMEAVVKAAQWDPRKPGSTITPVAGPSVLLVEKALNAKGLLKSTYVDGHFGTSTVTAYTAFQRSLGYTGLAANGIPGPTSLKKLGANRFTIVRPINVGSRVSYDGATFNVRTKTMLQAAEARIAPRLNYSQGSYSTSDPTSAGTHAGGGALDISVTNLTSAERLSTVKILRQVGFAAWLRSPSQGNWPWHIHAVAISDTDMSPEAQHQIGDYYQGLNGLANRAADDGPQVPKVTWEEYQRSL